MSKMRSSEKGGRAKELSPKIIALKQKYYKLKQLSLINKVLAEWWRIKKQEIHSPESKDK